LLDAYHASAHPPPRPHITEETWGVYYGDVQVGTIAEHAGDPTAKPGWQWSYGFYPGSHPSEHARGVAETFDQARGAFEIAWVFLRCRRRLPTPGRR